MKPIPYEALMQLDLKDIEATFPLGAIQEKDRWRPALEQEPCDRTLRRLLKDKKARIEQPRLLHKDSTRGYTHDPHMAMSHEPEAIDRNTQDRFSDEARAKEDNRRQVMRSRLAQLRELGIREIKKGKDPTPILDKALEELQRREAA